jgi:hypothetical protein
MQSLLLVCFRRRDKNSAQTHPPQMERWRQDAGRGESPTMSTTDTDESSGCEEVPEHEATSSRRGASGARATSGSHGTAASEPLGDPLARTPYRAWTKEASKWGQVLRRTMAVVLSG